MERKIKFLLFLLVCNFTLLAQDDKPIMKGNYLIGGYSNVKYENYDNQKQFIASFTPSVGYFISNNLVIGLSPSFGIAFSEKGESISKTRAYIYGIGPFVKYYFNKGPFLKMSSFYSDAINKYPDFPEDNHHSTSFSLSPGIGYAYFINKKVSFETELSYSYTVYKTSDSFGSTIKSKELSLNFGFQIFL